VRRLIVLALLALLLPTAPAAGAERRWADLVRETALTFAAPGETGAKRRLVADLAARGRDDAWVLVLAALEQEGRHLDALATERDDAWRFTQDLWSRPRQQHHTAHARRLRKSFEALGTADRRWFREQMLVGQMAMQLRAATPAARRLLIREATSPVRSLHPAARAAIAPLLAARLGDIEMVAAYRALLERDPDERVRLAALEALPAEGTAIPTLILRRLRDPAWVVRQVAARMLAKRGIADAAPLLVAASRRAGPREVLVYDEALRELAAPPAARAPGNVQLLGTPIPSTHVVFVLDCSAAMAPTLARAQAEVAAAIDALPASGSFGLVAYDGAVTPWKLHPVAATDDHKRAARAWLAERKPQWNACMDGGLRAAFRLAGLAPLRGGSTPIDTIVLVAAARPTGYAPGEAQPLRPGYLPRLVRVWNRDKRIRIQAVALGEQAVPILEQLTREHGGTLTRP